MEKLKMAENQRDHRTSSPNDNQTQINSETQQMKTVEMVGATNGAELFPFPFVFSEKNMNSSQYHFVKSQKNPKRREEVNANMAWMARIPRTRGSLTIRRKLDQSYAVSPSLIKESFLKNKSLDAQQEDESFEAQKRLDASTNQRKVLAKARREMSPMARALVRVFQERSERDDLNQEFGNRFFYLAKKRKQANSSGHREAQKHSGSRERSRSPVVLNAKSTLASFSSQKERQNDSEVGQNTQKPNETQRNQKEVAISHQKAVDQRLTKQFVDIFGEKLQNEHKSLSIIEETMGEVDSCQSRLTRPNHINDSSEAATLPKLSIGDFLKAEDIFQSSEFFEKCGGFQKHLGSIKVGSHQICIDNLAILRDHIKALDHVSLPASSSFSQKQLLREIQNANAEIKKAIPNLFGDVPATRKTFEKMESFLKEKLEELQKNTSENSLREANVYFTLIFHEMLRQVMLESNEKCRVFIFIWNTYFSFLALLISQLALKSKELVHLTVEKMNGKLEKMREGQRGLLMELEARKLKCTDLEIKCFSFNEQLSMALEVEKKYKIQTYQLKKTLAGLTKEFNNLKIERDTLKIKLEGVQYKLAKSGGYLTTNLDDGSSNLLPIHRKNSISISIPNGHKDVVQMINRGGFDEGESMRIITNTKLGSVKSFANRLEEEIRRENRKSIISAENFAAVDEEKEEDEKGESEEEREKRKDKTSIESIGRLERKEVENKSSESHKESKGQNDSSFPAKEELLNRGVSGSDESESDQKSEQISEIDVNYDAFRDKDFLMDEDFRAHLKVQEMPEEAQGYSKNCFKCNRAKFDKYTGTENDFEAEIGTQTDLKLLSKEFDDALKSRETIKALLSEKKERKRLFERFLGPFELTNPETRVDLFSEEIRVANEPDQKAGKVENEKEPNNQESLNSFSQRMIATKEDDKGGMSKEKKEKENNKERKSPKSQKSFSNSGRKSKENSIVLNNSKEKEDSKTKRSEEGKQFSGQSLRSIQLMKRRLSMKPKNGFDIFVNGKNAKDLSKMQINPSLKPRVQSVLTHLFLVKELWLEQERSKELQKKLEFLQEAFNNKEEETAEMRKSFMNQTMTIRRLKKRIDAEGNVTNESGNLIGGEADKDLNSQGESASNDGSQEMDNEKVAGEEEESENDEIDSQSNSQGRGLGKKRKNKKQKTKAEKDLINITRKPIKLYDRFEKVTGNYLLEKVKNKKISKKLNLIPVSVILKYISIVYKERVDQTKEKPSIAEEDLPSFIYNVFRKLYGKSKFLEQKFMIFMLSIRKNTQIARINIFAKFIGLDKSSNFTKEELNFYIESLNFLWTNRLGTSISNNDSAAVHYVPFIRAMEYLKIHGLRRFSLKDSIQFREDIVKGREEDPMKVNKLGIIDVDFLLNKLIMKKRIILEQTKQFVRSAFDAADLDGNGTISQDELFTLWKHLNPEKFNYFEVQEIFNRNSEMAPEEPEPVLSFSSFANICFKEGVFGLESQFRFIGVAKEEEIRAVFEVFENQWPNASLDIQSRIETCKIYDSDKVAVWEKLLEKIAERIQKKDQRKSKLSLMPILIISKIIDLETTEILNSIKDHGTS